MKMILSILIMVDKEELEVAAAAVPIKDKIMMM